MPGVIEDLKLRTRLPDLLVFLGGAINNAAVVPFGHLPIDEQFKVAELVISNNVAGGSTRLAPRQERTVFHLPALRYIFRAIAAPASK
jgi:hypothetical protein